MLKEKWTKRWLVILAGMIAPYFYLMGWQYSHSYYAQFGINHIHSGRSFHEYVALGFQNGGIAILEGFNWFISQNLWFYINLALVFITLIYIGILNEDLSQRYKKSESKFRLWVKRTFNNNSTKYTVVPLIVSGLMTIAIGALVIILLLLSACSLHGYQFAKYVASNQKAVYTACKPEIPNTKHDCTFVYDGSELVLSGMMVGSSSSRISIYNGQTETIELNGHRIVHQFKE